MYLPTLQLRIIAMVEKSIVPAGLMVMSLVTLEIVSSIPKDFWLVSLLFILLVCFRYEMQDLHVTSILPQMITLTEAYIQIYELKQD